MIAFQPLRSARLNVELRELTAADAIYLCKLPVSEQERGMSELLARIVEKVDKPRVGQAVDPALWTVQERNWVTCHYLAQTMIEGNPDFPVGEKGRFSLYLLPEMSAPVEKVDIGRIGDDNWCVYQLLGGYAEAIERLVLAGELTSDRGGWIVGAMAAQVYRLGEEPIAIDGAMPAAIDEAITKRATALLTLSESEFELLMLAFLNAMPKLDHIFRMQFGNEGIVFMPVSEEVPGLPPARFPFPWAVRASTIQVFGPDH